MPETIKQKSVYCDVCRTDMLDKNLGGTLVGMMFHIEPHAPHSEVTRLMKVFGKLSFHICAVCYLKALGVKPLKNKKK